MATGVREKSIPTIGAPRRPLVWPRFIFTASIFTLLVVVSASMIFPYVWMTINSFKEKFFFYTNPYTLIPDPFTIETYADALGPGMVGRFLFNSALYACMVVTAQLLINSLCAYAFARLEFPGRDVLFVLVLASMMLPGAVTLIPSFLVVNAFGLIGGNAGAAGSVLAVVLPSFAGAFGIFMLRQFFLNIPKELEDAAIVDGAGLLTTYWRIIMPLAKPALLTLGLLVFLSEWNSFIWPLIVLNNTELYTVTIGINLFRQEATTEWPRVFAGSVAATLPIIVLFLITQRYIIGGISLSGLKG